MRRASQPPSSPATSGFSGPPSAAATAREARAQHRQQAHDGHPERHPGPPGDADGRGRALLGRGLRRALGGLLRGLVGAGVAVPRHTAVLALGDDPLCEGGPVPLTVLRAPGRRLGSLAVTAVLDRLDGRAAPFEVRVPSELIERASTPPAGPVGKLLHE